MAQSRNRRQSSRTLEKPLPYFTRSMRRGGFYLLLVLSGVLFACLAVVLRGAIFGN